MIVEKANQGTFAFRLHDSDWLMKSAWRGMFSDIKKSIPSRCRRYDGSTKTWTVDDKFRDFVIQRLTYHFCPPDGVPVCEAGALARMYGKRKKPTRRFALGGVQTARTKAVA